MKILKELTFGTILLCASILLVSIVGCVTSKVQTVTPGANGSPAITNTVTVVNQANLDLDCAALQLVGTPALIYALEHNPSSRPIVVDIQMALNGALLGVDTNVQQTIVGIIGDDQALQAALIPLVQAASALNQQLLDKYGNVNAVIIGKAILKADLNIVNAALAAVPASTGSTIRPYDNDLVAKVKQRDGTNFIGVYLGMIAEHYDTKSVMMFSATSGEMLRWIPNDEFRQVYIDKTKPEYGK